MVCFHSPLYTPKPKLKTIEFSIISSTLSMAISKVLIASLFLSLLVLQQVQATTKQETTNAVSGGASSSKIDCKGACGARCMLSSRPNLCKRACGTCCYRCNCVPPGTSGNLEVCPCYANMTTRGNKRKCP